MCLKIKRRWIFIEFLIYTIIILIALIISICAFIIIITQFIYKNEQILQIKRIRKNLSNKDFYEYKKRYNLILNLENNKVLLNKFENKIKELDYTIEDFNDSNFILNNIVFQYPICVMDNSIADSYLKRNILKLNENINESTINRAIKLYYKEKEMK